MASLRERDVSALLEIVEIGARESRRESFPSAVLAALAELIPSNACVGYQEADVSGPFRVVDLVEIVGEPPSRTAEDAFHTLGWQNPMHCRLHARESRVLRLSDLLSRRQKRELEYDDAVWRPHGIDDALRVWMPAPPGRARSIYLERSGTNYTDREVALLTVLRPHLIRARQSAAARMRAAGTALLTPREAEILGWIANGKTNREIARLLVISPFTVRQHVENIFEKLGVGTRAAAVAAHAGLAANGGDGQTSPD